MLKSYNQANAVFFLCRRCSLLDHARVPYHQHTQDFHQWTELRDEVASHQRGHLRRDFPAPRRSYLMRTGGQLDRFLQRLPWWYERWLQNGHVPSPVSCIQLRAVHHANVYALQELYSYQWIARRCPRFLDRQFKQLNRRRRKSAQFWN